MVSVVSDRPALCSVVGVTVATPCMAVIGPALCCAAELHEDVCSQNGVFSVIENATINNTSDVGVVADIEGNALIDYDIIDSPVDPRGALVKAKVVFMSSDVVGFENGINKIDADNGKPQLSTQVVSNLLALGEHVPVVKTEAEAAGVVKLVGADIGVNTLIHNVEGSRAIHAACGHVSCESPMRIYFRHGSGAARVDPSVAPATSEIQRLERRKAWFARREARKARREGEPVLESERQRIADTASSVRGMQDADIATRTGDGEIDDTHFFKERVIAHGTGEAQQKDGDNIGEHFLEDSNSRDAQGIGKSCTDHLRG